MRPFVHLKYHKLQVKTHIVEQHPQHFIKKHFYIPTLESRIDVGQGINVGPGKFGKKNNVGP